MSDAVSDYLWIKKTCLAAVFTNTVENNDCIVKRVPDERKEGGYHCEVDFKISD